MKIMLTIHDKTVTIETNDVLWTDVLTEMHNALRAHYAYLTEAHILEHVEDTLIEAPDSNKFTLSGYALIHKGNADNVTFFESLEAAETYQQQFCNNNNCPDHSEDNTGTECVVRLFTTRVVK